MHRFITRWLCLPLGLLATAFTLSASGKEFTLAVVMDGPSAESSIVSEIKTELDRLLGDEHTVVLKFDPTFDAGWDAARLMPAIQSALDDSEVDMLLGVGLLVTQVAAMEEFILSKPFISTYVQRADLPKLPYSGSDRSLKENLVLMAIPANIRWDIERFRQIIPFTKLHVGMDQLEMHQFSNVTKLLARYGDSLGVEIVPVGVAEDADIADLNIESEVQAFFLTRLPRLIGDKRTALISKLSARGIPTFSLLGHTDVELGALAGLMPDISRQIVRRVSLNIGQILRGKSTKELSVFLSVGSSLLINGRTAATIGYIPNAEIRAYSTFLNEEALRSDATPITFAQSLEFAKQQNVSLSVVESSVETARRDRQLARSRLYPQLFAFGAYLNTNLFIPDPIFPEDVTKVGVKLNQMIYNDQKISNFRSATRIAEAANYNFERERLDVLASAGTAFLQFVLSQVLFKVAAKNVLLTEQNLEMARIRFDVGFAGLNEVYRWESEISERRGELILSEAQVEVDRIALNQVIGMDQSIRWLPEEIEVDPTKFYFLDGQIDSVFRVSTNVQNFVEQMVKFGTQQAPELQIVDKLIEAQGIQVGQSKRRWFVPTISMNLFYDYDLHRDPDNPGWDDDNYGIELIAAYPLFTGGSKHYDIKRQSSELNTIILQREQARELVERRVRSSISRMGNTFPTIQLTRNAAVASHKNLIIVQEKYIQGLVSITDLLDAQTQSFRSDQNAAASSYQFLLDLVRFQRSISWFEDDKTPAERDEFLQGIRDVLSAP